MRNRVLIVGPSRCGKDVAGEFIERLTGARYAGTCSTVIAEYIAEEDGVPVEVAYARRHENRDRWYQKGKELREEAPGFLISKLYNNGNIASGIRDACEIDYLLENNLVSDIIWIERDVPPDPTLEFDLQYIVNAMRDCGSTPFLHVVFNVREIEDFKMRLMFAIEQIDFLHTREYEFNKEQCLEGLRRSLAEKRM